MRSVRRNSKVLNLFRGGSAPIGAAVLCIATWLGVGDTRAQQFRDWFLEQDSTTCVVSTRVHLRQTNTFLVAVSLSVPDDAEVLMTVEVPVGASLRDRIAYVHAPDAPARTLDWQFCGTQTCLATMTVEADELSALKAGASITVAFRPLPGAQVLAAPVSLMGLTRGWAALEACVATLP